MELVEKDSILRKFEYLNDSEIDVEMAILNEKTLCVNVSAPIKKIKELITNHGWNCILDGSVSENVKVFTCIVKEVS